MALKPELAALLMDGPTPAQKTSGYVRFGGIATLRVVWRRHRAELMAACGPGRRPWAFWMLEKHLKQRPAGEAGELRMIRTMQAYTDDKEREIMHRRLNAIVENMRKHRNRNLRVA
jgi:hypothetical protein